MVSRDIVYILDGGHHVAICSIFVAFCEKLKDASHEPFMANGQIYYYQSIHAITVRWQACISYDGHLTVGCFEDSDDGVHTHKIMETSDPVKEFTDI